MCMLSTSFMRMYTVARAKWGDKSPFTVLSTTNQIDVFYRNPDEKAHWREVRRCATATHDVHRSSCLSGTRRCFSGA